MYSAKDCEEKKINRHKPHRSKISMRRRSCCVFDGTAKELCIMSCFCQTINSEKYCSQLNRLKAAIDEKRPELSNRHGVVFHQDNARSHVPLTTRQKLLQFGWDVLPHPLYSPDIAPSDFYLFRTCKIFLMKKISFF